MKKKVSANSVNLLRKYIYVTTAIRIPLELGSEERSTSWHTEKYIGSNFIPFQIPKDRTLLTPTVMVQPARQTSLNKNVSTYDNLKNVINLECFFHLHRLPVSHESRSRDRGHVKVSRAEGERGPRKVSMSFNNQHFINREVRDGITRGYS